MSAPPDPALAKRLLDEIGAEHYYDELGGVTAASILYLLAALLNGRWCDFSSNTRAGEVLEVLETLKPLPCWPLLAPFLEPGTWSEDDITALRVKERLKS